MPYKATPAQIAFPITPVPQKRVATPPNQPPLDVRKVRFPTTCLAEADERTEELVRYCEWLFRSRRLEELVKKIERMPHLVFNSRIRKIWLEVQEFRRTIRPQGRPYGQGEHPLLVAAMVEELLARGRAKTRDIAFSELARYGIPYSKARDLWYQAWSDPRFKPLFHKEEALTREASPEEIAALRQLPTLRPGRSASCKIEHPQLGTLTFTLTAESD